jgi:hypothetical protein
VIAPAAPSYIKGRVIDALLRGLSAAVVEVLDGPESGTTVVSNAEGEFQLQSTRPPTLTAVVNLRVSKDGYQPLTTSATWTPLGALSPPVILRLQGSESYDAIPAGDYTMTIAFDVGSARGRIPDAPCPGYPAELASRTYNVRITPGPAGVRHVSVSDVNPPFSFPMFVADDRVVLDFGDEGIREDLPGFRLLSVWAFVPPRDRSSTTIGSSISFPVSAEFWYCELKEPRGIYNNCSQVPGERRLAYHICGDDHASMTFTRR